MQGVDVFSLPWIIPLCLHFVISISLFLIVKALARETSRLNRETFGLVKRIEVLTASRREHFVYEYDKLVDKLSKRLPTAIAEQVGCEILETERDVLLRLSELDGSSEHDKAVNQLLVTMERLEDSVCRVTADTALRVMSETRRTIMEDERFADL